MANERTARQAIKVWLAEHDKTQQWLAMKLGISAPAMSTILSGYTPASDEVRKKLHRLTGIDIAAFAKVA